MKRDYVNKHSSLVFILHKFKFAQDCLYIYIIHTHTNEYSENKTRQYVVDYYHSLKTRMQLNQERRLIRQSQNSFFHHCAFNIVILDNNILFQDFDRVQFIRALSFGQHYLCAIKKTSVKNYSHFFFFYI